VGFLIFVGAVAGIWLWVRAEWRSYNRWTIERDRLEREARWFELRAYIEAHFASWSPIVRILGQWPRGAAQARHSRELLNLGDHVAALTINDRALALATEPQTRLAVLATRALILDALGRYDEAVALVPAIRAVANPPGLALNAIAVVKMNHGRLHEALAMLEPTIAGGVARDDHADHARTIAARVLTHKGEYAAALALFDGMQPEPVDSFRKIDAGSTGPLAERVERNRARSREAFKTIRLLAVAQVHVTAGEAMRALETLTACAQKEWSKPAIEASYQRLMARAFALLGDASRADAHLQRLRQIFEHHPDPALSMSEHAVAGICALHLGRYDEALTLFAKADGAVRRPLERHGLAFFIAETHARAGHAIEAEAAYRTVVADGFETHFHARAAAALRG
jgi:tetratricopeptide (TPR) repeat protein